MLAWFHAVTQERLRYAPLGWSKMFEFGDTDKRCALETIDYWIESVSQGRDNLGPDRIPWEAIRTLLGQSVYGGRIDNRFDQRLLDSFLNQWLCGSCFDVEFPLAEFVVNESTGEKGTITAPEGTTKKEFLQWIQALPDKESPVWLGLPQNAELLLLINQSKRMVSRFLKMQTVQVESDDAAASMDDSMDQTSSMSNNDGDDVHRPAWADSLLKFVTTWKGLLPKELKELERTAKAVSDPLFRFFEREALTGIKLLKKIHADLETLTEVANGNQKQTNYIRSLMNSINKALIPDSWRIYSVSDSTSLTAWLVDFIKRIEQLQEIQKSRNYGGRVWMGGLFNPEAFMTATRQAAARTHGWSLENLELTAKVLDSDSVVPDEDPSAFIVTGLSLESARWDGVEHQLAFSSSMSYSMPPVQFSWKLSEDLLVNAAAAAASDSEHQPIVLPIYLNEMRLELLFSVAFNGPKSVLPTVWYQRGVALLSTRPA